MSEWRYQCKLCVDLLMHREQYHYCEILSKFFVYDDIERFRAIGKNFNAARSNTRIKLRTNGRRLQNKTSDANKLPLNVLEFEYLQSRHFLLTNINSRNSVFNGGQNVSQRCHLIHFEFGLKFFFAI